MELSGMRDSLVAAFRSCAKRGLYPLDGIGSGGVDDVPAGEPGG
jgi:hypothetical protein